MIVRTLSTLAVESFANVADRMSNKTDTEMLKAFDKVSPVVARIVAQALPELSADQLRNPTEEIAAQIFVVCSESNVFRSLAAFPLATISEAQAALTAHKVRSILPLPNKLAIAIRSDNSEYRANDSKPAHCSKVDASSDALTLCLKNTRAIRSALAYMLDSEDKAARKLSKTVEAAPIVTVEAKPAKTKSKPSDKIKAPRIAPKRASKTKPEAIEA